MPKLYVVTGGCGFIGSHITTALLARGDRVRVVDDLSSGTLDNLGHLPVSPHGSGKQLELLQADVTQPGVAAAACAGADGVFHEAAQVSVPESIADPIRSYEINVMGTLRMLEAAHAAGVQRFVFAASAAAYGNDPELPKREHAALDPRSPYASGKIAGEHLLQVWGQLHGMRTVALRYFNVFGPRQADDSPYTGVIAIFASRLLQGKPVTIFGDGEQTRDFVSVHDVVAANLLAASADAPPGAVINVGTGSSISVNQLYSSMCEHLQLKAPANYGPERAGDVKHSRPSIERARQWLGYEPKTEFRQALAETLDWYKARHQAAS